MYNIIMKNLLLFGCLTLFACAKTQKSVKYAGEDFAHTSSMCLDALLVNMDKNHCSNTVMESYPGLIKIYCDEKEGETETFWTDRQFFLIPMMSNVEVVGGMPVCIDYNFGIYTPIVPETNTEAQINEEVTEEEKKEVEAKNE